MSSRRRTKLAAFSLFSFQDIITSITGIMILVTLILALELVSRTESAPTAQTNQQITTTEKSIAQLKAEITTYQRELDSQSGAFADLPSLDRSYLAQLVQDSEDAARQLQSDLSSLRDRQVKRKIKLDEVEPDATRQQLSEEQQVRDLERQVAAAQKKLAELQQSRRIFFQSGVHGKTMWLVEVTSQGFLAAQIGVSAPPKRYTTASALGNWISSLDSNSNAIYMTVKPSGVSNFELGRKEIQQHNFDVGYQVVGEQQQVLDPNLGAATP
jgi:hypothetical protein